MTVTLTLTPLFWPLTLALAVASATAGARATYLLVVLVCGRRELLGKTAGWQAVTVALLSAVLFSAGTWQFGGLLAALAWACGFHWRRMRGEGRVRA